MLNIPKTELWLGNTSDLRDIRAVLKTGVTAIIDLAIEEPLPSLPRTTNYCRVVLTDDGENNPANILAAILAAGALVDGGHAVAICCNAGLNRSLAIAAATLARLSGKSAAECLELVATVKHVDVNPALWNQVVGVLAGIGSN
jgi:protein-tyrosine phosphatase